MRRLRAGRAKSRKSVIRESVRMGSLAVSRRAKSLEECQLGIT
jgi:hypothetical protein